jgi:single-stranded-DNA-specific exonuclease
MTQDLSFGGKRWQMPAENHDRTTFIAQRLNQLGLPCDRAWDDPTVFPDAEKAVMRVRSAIDAHEKIAIFGDYDCDGITSTAQLLRCLRRHGTEPAVRLPHRMHDGYGLRPKHVDECATQGVTLLMTVDTGISAHEALSRARELGIDVIILDHHHWTIRPDAYAILHPDLAPDFPKPHPSAAGVVFLFLHAMENGYWQDRDTDLALALFGTVADLVPLAGINRTLVQEGLRALTRLPDGPVKRLVESVGKGKPLTSVDVAFRIAPRINAAGRMGDPMLALTALLDGGEPLRALEQMNTLRQEETARCIEHALEKISPDGDLSHETLPAFLAIADVSYSPGIIGLIAGKLTERFGRPSMAAHIKDDECTASLRSIGAYNIVEGLDRVSHLLSAFGGHAQAAGCSFPLAHFAELTRLLDADIVTKIDSTTLFPTLQIDAVIDANAITNAAVLSLAELEPYGQGNQEPLFLVQNARLTNLRRVGADGKHLQATVGNAKVIGFGMGEWERHAESELDLVCKLGLDSFGYKTVPQLFLVDARVAKKTEESEETEEPCL